MYGLEEFFVELLGALLVLFVIWAGAALVLYLLKAMAIYRMAQHAGMPSPGLAWVPVANNYLLGLLCDRAVYCRTGKQWRFSIILPVLDLLGIFGGSFSSILYGIATGLFYFGSSYADWMERDIQVVGNGFIGLAYTVAMAIALYYLFCDYEPGREVSYTVLAVIFGSVAQSILLFVLRHRVPLSVRGGGYPPPWQQPYPGGPGQAGGPGGYGAPWGQPPGPSWQGSGAPGQDPRWDQPPGGGPPAQGPWAPQPGQPPASPGGPWTPPPGQAPYSGQNSPQWQEPPRSGGQPSPPEDPGPPGQNGTEPP